MFVKGLVLFILHVTPLLVINQLFSSCVQLLLHILNANHVDAPKAQLPPFTPPKFHWNQDNLYEQFNSFKRVVEFAFKGQYKKCSILNWLGIEAYPVYNNLPITEEQKQDPEQLLDAFKKYFKPERNIF